MAAEKPLLAVEPRDSSPAHSRTTVQSTGILGSRSHNDETMSAIGSGKRRVRITPLLVLSVVATVLGSSTQFGYNIGVINSPETAIRASFNQTSNNGSVDSYSETEWAFTVSIFLIGGMVGSLPAGILADLIGRKWALLCNNVILLGGVALESLAIDPYMLIAGRFVVGVNAGLNTVLAPMYLSEISPLKYRGAIGAMHQLAITLAILFSQILGLHQLLGQSDQHFHAWRILLAVPLVFMVIQLLTLPFCPESPKYLYIRRRKEEAAEKALRKLCGDEDVQEQILAMKEEYNQVSSSSSSSLAIIVKFIKDPALRRPLLVSLVLHTSQQLTGIGSILFYSTHIFGDAGIKNGDVATALVGVILVIGTVVTIILIDYVGRRTLMLYGLGGMTVGFLLFTSMFCFQYGFYGNSPPPVTAPGVLLVMFTIVITFTFAIGPGAIPWLMVSELFQQETRPPAVSIATIVNWLSNFAVGEAFPYMLTYLSPYATLFFAVSCGLFWFLEYLYLPETKGRTVAEMAEHFQQVTSAKDCCSGLEIRQSRDTVKY